MAAPDAERFDRLAATYDQTVPFFATLGTRLVDWVNPKVGDRILDLGCGRGAVTVALSRLLGPDCDVVAGDVSENMLSYVRALSLPGVKVKYLDSTDIDEPGRSFDVIFGAFVLHFLARAPDAFKEIARVLRTSGVFAMSVPGPSTDDGWWDTYDGITADFSGRLNRPSQHHFGGQDLEELIAGAGLKVTESINTEVALPVDGPEVHWQWLLQHSLRGLYEALDDDDRAELRNRVLQSLREEHPVAGMQLIAGADFYLMTAA